MTRGRPETAAEMQTVGLQAARARIRRLRRLRALRRSPRDPRAIAMRRRSLPILNELYPGFNFNEIRAIFPMKKVGSGPGTRYVLVPRHIDAWLDQLPDA